MKTDIQALKKIIPDDARLMGGDMADVLVFPLTTNEVSNIMQYANTNNIPVTPRGAGTNLVGSTVPVKGGIVLDLSKMDQVLELDKDTLTATVEAGILLQDFQAYVEGEGLFYPPDPGEKASTIGGNISTNAGGMRAVKYGVTRDYVRGLEIVTADGTIMTVGGKNVKDASGLSLKNLIIGSEGTLAVITKCILKLIPKPEVSISVLVPYFDLKAGISSVLDILRSNANPTAVEFMERKVVQLGERYTGVRYPREDAGSYILLTFDGNKAQVDSDVELVRKLTLSHGAMDYIVLTDPDYSAEIWKVRGELVKAVEDISEQEPIDIVVPISQTAAFIKFINKLEQQSGMRMISFGHAGDGNVHLCVVRENREEKLWQQQLNETMKCAYAEAYRLGGLTSGEHGIGISKRKYFLQQTPKENLQVMNSIKNAFDPKHILNDQKSYIEEGFVNAETF